MNPFLPTLHSVSFSNLTSYDKLWLCGGILTLVLYAVARHIESKNRPNKVQLSLQNLYFSPAEIGYFLKGAADPGNLLAASFLDLIRRNYLIFEDDSFVLTQTNGPKRPQEEYLLNWLNSFSKDGQIRLGAIKGRRLNEADEYFKDLQTWFDQLETSLIDHGLKYKMRANRGNSTFYLCAGIFLLIVGLIGLSQKFYFALIPILTGFLFVGLAVRIYGALPPKGQSVHHYIYPLISSPKNKIYKTLSKLNEESVFLYALAVNRNLIEESKDMEVTRLYKALSQERPWELIIKDYFIGSNFLM